MTYNLTPIDKEIKKIINERLYKIKTSSSDVHKIPIKNKDFQILKSKRRLLKILENYPKAQIAFIYEPTKLPNEEIVDFQKMSDWSLDSDFKDLYKFTGYWKGY